MFCLLERARRRPWRCRRPRSAARGRAPRTACTSVPRRAVGGGDLGARRARADARPASPAARSSAHASSVPITRPPNSVPGIGLRHRAGGEDDRLARLDSVRRSPTLTLPSPASEPTPSMTSILFFLNRPGDAAGERLDDLLAALARPWRSRPCGSATVDAELVGLVDLGEHVGDAQHGLGGDAGVVQAAAADACPSRPRRSSSRAGRRGSRPRSRPGPEPMTMQS